MVVAKHINENSGSRKMRLQWQKKKKKSQDFVNETHDMNDEERGKPGGRVLFVFSLTTSGCLATKLHK